MGINTKKCSIAAAIALAFSGQALAAQTQEVERAKVAESKTAAQTKVSQQEAAEKITVTGSRIKRDSFSVPTPIATISRDAIDDSGLGSLSEILVDELPQVNEGTSNGNSQSSVQNTGLSTIDLRNLGTNRTLTLVDGRRVVSNSYSGNYVSLSTIPTSMVERVEIITGGASSAYGSDAIAGVVNIITQQDKEGMSFKVRGGQATEGAAEEITADFDYGTTYAGGKGYAFFSATYDEQFGIKMTDRDRAMEQTSFFYDAKQMCNAMYTEMYDTDRRTNVYCMRDIEKSDWRNLSDGIAGGLFNEKSSLRPDAGFWYDGQTLRSDWHEEKYGIQSAALEQLRIPDRAIAAAFKTEFEFDSGLEAYFQFQYSQNKAVNSKSPEDEDECDVVITHDTATGEFGEDCVGRIPKDNPYMPDEIRAGTSSSGATWDRRLFEVGHIVNTNTRDTFRTWGGLRGYIWDSWEWDISAGYGKFKQFQDRKNEIFVANMRNALNAEVLPDGTIQCKDEAARANGCVPINLFGEGSITPEAAAYIRANPTITTRIEQTTLNGFMTGDLFELPAGTASAAFGFEYRKDEQSVATNVPEGGVSFNYVPTFAGDVSVYEVFGEVSVPLLKDAPGAKQLTAEASARLADYSWATTGLIQSYKAGLIWEIVDGYSLRTNWATAQRAPTITDLMSPPRGDYDSFTDPCKGVTIDSTLPGHDNCRKDPGIAKTIAEEGTFGGSSSIYSPNVGNPDLIEESAKTFTAGLSLAPSFVDGLRVAIDYYDIRVEDALTSYSNEDIAGFCYNSDLAYGSDNKFCNDIRRDEDGYILEIKQRLINADEIRTSGYDLAVEYKFDLNDFGDLKLKADWNHVIGYSITKTGPDGQFTDSYEGYLFNGIFEDKGSASLSWRLDDLRVTWSTRYKSSIKRSQATEESWLSAIATNTANCADGKSSCVENPELYLEGQDLPSYITHNLSMSYSIDLGKDLDMRVFGGVNNLFDDKGPYVFGGTGNFDSQYGGGRGRFAFVGMQVNF